PAARASALVTRWSQLDLACERQADSRVDAGRWRQRTHSHFASTTVYSTRRAHLDSVRLRSTPNFNVSGGPLIASKQPSAVFALRTNRRARWRLIAPPLRHDNDRPLGRCSTQR